MKKIIMLAITPLLIYAEFSNYKQRYGNIIFLLDNNLLNNGKYENKDFEIENFSLSSDEYYLTNKTYRPFILGAFGYSKYEDNEFDDNSLFAKVGGGINIVASNKISNSFGVTYTKMFTPKVSKATIYYQFNYKTLYNSIEPYINFKTAYSYIDYSKDDIKEVKGANLELNIGAIKKDAFRLWGLPVNVKGYSQLIILDDKLAEINDFDSLYTAGVIFGWELGRKFSNEYLKNLQVKLTLQGSKSNRDFKGYRVGVGLTIFEF